MKQHHLASAESAEAFTHECTSWIVFSDLLGNHTNMLHKNRDSSVCDITVLLGPEDAPYRWIGLGDDHLPGMGINRDGLAGAMNSGEICVDPSTDDSKKTTPQILHAILGHCGSAAQAAEMLQDFLRQGDYWHGKYGSIFLFADTREGLICEMTAKNCLVQRFDRRFVCRANLWHNPGMEAFSRLPQRAFLDSSVREHVVRETLGAALDARGVITPADSLTLARRCTVPEGSPLKRSVCSKETNSACDLVIDLEFPETLSTMYALVGRPRHTVLLPFPVCTEKLDPRVAEPVFAAAAQTRCEQLGFDAPIPAEWSCFEEETLSCYGRVMEEARLRLRQGKPAEAEALLNRASSELCAQAAELLNL